VTGPAPEDERRDKPLAMLARAAGIQTSYVDTGGVRHRASADALLGVLGALGVEVAGRDDADRARAELEAQRGAQVLPTVVVAWDGELRLDLPAGVGDVRLVLEDGQEHPISERLPAGAHRLVVGTADGEQVVHVLAAPTRLPGSAVPRHRRFGVFAPTYALRRTEDDRGMGDLRALETLAVWADDHRASLVATLPLLPTFLGEGAEPFEPSPYSPVSRLAWSEAYLDLAALPGGAASTVPRADGRALVDWRHQSELVRRALDAALVALGDRGLADVEAWAATDTDAAAYATFRARTERDGPWSTWAHTEVDPDPAVVRRHLVAQWAMDQQLGNLAGRLRARGQVLYLDLPIGAHPDGYDTWRHRSSFAPGVSVGAPPDGFFAGGQDWGFPPLHPERSRADGHAYLRACIAHHLRHAGMLRIDHVMAVHRLWWVPPGLGADQGAYVRYPADELYAAILIEAERVGAEVVGEDLGTVPGEIRRSLGRHGLLGMYATQFELPVEPGIGARPHTPRRRDLALLNTHDMATFTAFWTASDVDLREKLGLLDEAGADDERQRRAVQRWAVVEWLATEGHKVDEARPEPVLQALVQVLGAGPARWVLLTLEDLWSEQEPQNVPGVGGDRYPSWRCRVAVPVDDLDTAGDLLDCLHAARASTTPEPPRRPEGTDREPAVR